MNGKCYFLLPLRISFSSHFVSSTFSNVETKIISWATPQNHGDELSI